MGNYNTRAIRFLQSPSDFPLMVSLGEKNPTWGVSRWGGRGLRFVPPDDEGFAVRGDKQKLEYKGRRRSHRFTILGDSAFEYDVILNREPDSNVISLRMEGAENFDFFRQPDFVPGQFLKGSYAVYKKETLLGDGTGKLCHIHRPEIIDARGRRCWGDLAVVGNELRITIPEKWLSEAAYPVIVDPTVGTSTLGSLTHWDNVENESYDQLYMEVGGYVNRFLIPETLNGLLTAYVYAYEPDYEGPCIPVLYSDNNNVPLARRSANEGQIDGAVNSNKPAGWRSTTLKTNTSIASGNYIWYGLFCWWFAVRFDFGAKSYFGDWMKHYYNIPETYTHYGANWFSNFKISMYFTYSSAQNYVRTLTQGVDLSDKIKTNWFHQRLISDISILTDQAMKSVGHLRKIIANVKINDLVNRGLFFLARIVSGVHIRDFVTDHFLKSNTKAELKSTIQREIVLGGNAFMNGAGMGRIFKGQSALRITIKTFVDLEGIEKTVIKYRKPNGRTGEFAAAIGDTAQGVIFHECVEGDIDASGWWSFWAFVTFADGRTAAGQAAKVFVWKQGSG